MALGARPKNFQYQGGSVNHLAGQGTFQIAMLNRGQTGIDNDQRMIQLFGILGYAFHHSWPQQGGRTWPCDGDNLLMDNIQVDRLCQPARLCQPVLRTALISPVGGLFKFRLKDKSVVHEGVFQDIPNKGLAHNASDVIAQR